VSLLISYLPLKSSYNKRFITGFESFIITFVDFIIYLISFFSIRFKVCCKKQSARCIFKRKIDTSTLQPLSNGRVSRISVVSEGITRHKKTGLYEQPRLYQLSKTN